jgi:hypothetical protein
MAEGKDLFLQAMFQFLSTPFAYSREERYDYNHAYEFYFHVPDVQLSTFDTLSLFWNSNIISGC